MKRSIIAMLIVAGISGCANTSESAYDKPVINTENTNTATEMNSFSELSVNDENVDYPKAEFVQLQVTKGTHTITAANALANELGIRFVEWDSHLNPYSYSQPRNQLVSLNDDDPQGSFLQLFDSTGLLAVYDESENSVLIRPFAMKAAGKSLENFVFTPMFKYAELEKETTLKQNKNIGKVYEHHYYKGFTIRETVDAWAKKIGVSAVIWRLQNASDIELVDTKLDKNGIELSEVPIKNISKFITKQQSSLGFGQSIKVLYEKKTKRLIIHSFDDTQNIYTFEVKATTLKDNLARLAETYDYTLQYEAMDYHIRTPYITAITDYIERSVNHVIQQYPVNVEVIESTKIIKIRDIK